METEEAAMAHATAHSVGVVQMTDEQASAMLDRAARKYMGISGAEFTRRVESGEWQDRGYDEVEGLAEVWAYYLPNQD
ncbi:hypothetical protein [Actinokineospora bangkokensis]|nr:hypothetical protein [Actinokineospora bangkokensis]